MSSTDDKAFTDLQARFALRGHELRVIRKGTSEHFEIRREGECRTCSTEHAVRGCLAAMTGGSSP